MGDSYFGGKGAAGVVQQLINHIPPHDVLIVPFAGHCALSRRIAPARRLILCDLDPSVDKWWSSRTPPHGSFLRTDGLLYLEQLAKLKANQFHLNANGNVMIYCDPPYRIETRTSATRYRFDWDDATHDRFLHVVSRLHAAKYSMMISHYPDMKYNDALKDWNTVDFNAMTRGGCRIERIWFNYTIDDLHDYRFYCGQSSKQKKPNKQREVMKRREQSAMRKIRAMAPLERKRFLRSLIAKFGDGSSLQPAE